MSPRQYDQNIITLALVKFAGVNPRTLDFLLRSFGSWEELLKVEPAELSAINGISKGTARRISQTGQSLEKAAEYVNSLKKRDIKINTRFDIDYPSALIEINDPPPLLYNRGKFPLNGIKCIALIGTHNPTQPGLALTTKLAKILIAQNVQVISSLSRGIDMAVHLACKAAGSYSFAIIESGIDHIAGEVEVPLAIDIAGSGGIIGEYAPEETFREKHFKECNRLIAGMAQAVVVTEFHQDATRVRDILEYCHQIGKLSFILIDPEFSDLTDEASLAEAIKWGAIPMKGLQKVGHIIKSLV